MKIICSGAIPGPSLLRLLFHSNPDRLADLAVKADHATGAERKRIAAEFTRILQDIRVGDVWRQTQGGRLPEAERAILHYIRQRPGPPDSPLQVLDLGASDGVTTLDLVKAIRGASERPIKTYLADLHLSVFRYAHGALAEYRTSTGEPIMARFGPVGLRLPDSEHVWHVPARLLARWYLARERLRASLRLDREISLVNPLVRGEPGIVTIQMDCMQRHDPLVGQLDVVRASNVISPRYDFVGERLWTVLGHLHAYLREGGCLLISRNDRFVETEHGSTWVRTERGFRHLADFGGGSEIKEQIASFVSLPRQATDIGHSGNGPSFAPVSSPS